MSYYAFNYSRTARCDYVLDRVVPLHRSKKKSYQPTIAVHLMMMMMMTMIMMMMMMMLMLMAMMVCMMMMMRML